MNKERNYQTKAMYKKGNLLYMIRVTKINSELGKCADSTQRKMLISKDGSPAIWIDKEIRTSKFMMETKNF